MADRDSTMVAAIIDQHDAIAAKCHAHVDVDALVVLLAADTWQMPPPLASRDGIRDFWHAAVHRGNRRSTPTVRTVAASDPFAVARINHLVHWRHDADGEWRIVGDAR